MLVLPEGRGMRRPSTPLLDRLKSMAPTLVRICVLEDAPEAVEARLANHLNAEFGDTNQSSQALDDLHNALMKALR